MTLYRQNDPRWAKDLLGYNTEPKWNMANFGCLITCETMLLGIAYGNDSWTPAKLNEFMQDHDGFDPKGGLLRWYKVAEYFPDLGDQGTRKGLVDADWLTVPTNYAILEVNNGAHFVLAINRAQIADPLDGKLKSIKTYPVKSSRLYSLGTPGKGSGAVTNKEEVMNKLAVNWGYRATADREPTAEELSYWTGRPVEEYLQSRYENNEEFRYKANHYDELKKLLDEQPKPSFQSTYVAEVRSRINMRDGVQHNYEGAGPDLPAPAGTHFAQAGTFVVDGVTLVRTAKGEKAGTWYGIPETVFDDGPSKREVDPSTVHVVLSMGSGLAAKFEAFLNGILKRN